MTLPIYAYGHPILRQKTEEIDTNYPDLKSLVDKMWETMYNAQELILMNSVISSPNSNQNKQTRI